MTSKFIPFLIVSFFFVQLECRASVLLEFDNGTLNPDSVSINPGESFSFDVRLTSTSQSTVGLTYFLSISTIGDLSNPGSGQFTLTARNISGTPYSDLQTSNSTFLLPANAILNPQNNNDAGGLEPDLSPLSSGTYFVATFTVQSSLSLPPGNYQIDFSNAVYIDEEFNPHSFDALGTYSVAVVPEPSSCVLVATGSLFALSYRSRRYNRRSLAAAFSQIVNF